MVRPGIRAFAFGRAFIVQRDASSLKHGIYIQMP